MTDELRKLIEEHRRLVEENAALRHELEDVRWAADKTNQGIKHLYRELERQNRELQKLDALKSEFVSTVSHELRTPLAIIREAVDQIADGVHGPVSAGQAQTLAMAVRGADRLTRLVADLLDLSRIESGKTRLKLESADLAACTRDIVETFRPAAQKKGLSFQASVPDTLKGYVDRDKFEQILTNLLSNAVKFTDSGGIRLELAAEGRTARVSVADTGIGIPAEDLPRVFSKFEQFSRNRGAGDKGAGLGLAICKGLVEMHGGSIEVSSKSGAGSRFEVRIPLRSAQEAVDEILRGMKDRASARGTVMGVVTAAIAVSGSGPALRPEESEKVFSRLDAVVKECLRRQEDAFVRDGGRVWVLLPEADRQAARAVYERVREKIQAFLEREGAGRMSAEYGLTLIEQEETLTGADAS